MTFNKLGSWTAAAYLLFTAICGLAHSNETETRPSSTPPEGPPPAPWFGGAGGGPPPFPLNCPYVIGLSGHSGQYVDSLSLTCMAGDGGSMPGAGPVGGAKGGAFNQPCPTNYYATGVWGARGIYVDAIGLICRDLATASSRFMTDLHGGTGGSSFMFECPAGSHLSGFNVHTGEFIDAIQPTCAVD